MEKPIKQIAIFQKYLSAADSQQNLCPDPAITPQLSDELNIAFHWYLVQAQAGNPTAQYYVGTAYYYTLGAATDIAKAQEWFQKVAAQNNVRAMYQLGMISYAGGTKIPQSDYIDEAHKAALHWFTKAATNGDAQSQLMLSLIYLTGWSNVEKNEKAAYQWTMKAVDQKNAAGFVALGDFYFYGVYVGQNYEEALSFYQKSLPMPKISFVIKKYVLDKLVYMYANGLGTSKDLKKSDYYDKQLKALLAEKYCVRS